MSHFVRDDVRFREIASGAEPVLELMEKTQVDINASIFGTIERTGRAAGETAAGLNDVCEE